MQRHLENLELRGYSSHFSIGHKITRGLWNLVWFLFFLPTPDFLHGWRNFLLKLFGARIGRHAHVYPSVRIWAPWNLTMGEGACLAVGVDCYCVDKIQLGDWAIVSQRAFLCTATHDIRSERFELVTKPIVIGEKAWIAAEAFVGPGVQVGEGAVVGARSAVFNHVDPWTVVRGNPAIQVGKRTSKRPTKN
jgi:putative colanic acid biosynthesis acetyltransferase WcaF